MMPTRRPVCRRFESGVSAAAAAAPGDKKGFIGCGQILQDSAGGGLADQRAGRHFDDKVRAFLARFLIPLPAGTALGLEGSLETKLIKRPFAVGSLKDNRTAIAAVTAVRASPGNEPFPSETDTAATAVSRLNGDGHFIDEFHSA